MTFANIALKNVVKKFRNYLVYFISTAFSVLVFHMFCSLFYNPTFEKYRFGTGKMSVLFKGSAIAVFLFAAVFVIYSGSYFLKTQKKEIAIYSLLGMRKAQIAFMMFFETFFIGLAAVAFGTFIGTIFSGAVVKLLLRFMAESTNVVFQVEPRAILVTILAFIFLFAFSGLRAYRAIYRYTLVDLLSADKQTEGVPGYSIWGIVAATLCLTISCVILMTMNIDAGGMKLLKPTFISGLFVLLGTFFLFANFVPMVVCKLKKRRCFYFETANFISTSQLSFRLKANARMFTVIALLTATTITMLSAAYSFYNLIGGEGTEAYAPFSYLAKNIDEGQYEKIKQTIDTIGSVKLVSEDKIELIKIKIYNKDYAVKDQQTGEAIPGLEVGAYLMSESMYQRIIEDTHTPIGKLSETRTSFEGGLDDDSCFFIDGNAVDDYCLDLPGQKMQVTFDDIAGEYNVTGIALHKYLGALDLYKQPTIVVSDSNFLRYAMKALPADIDIFYGFQFDDDFCSGQTVDAINEFIPARFHLGGLPENMSYIGVYKANFALFGSYAFIGFFLGVLFLMASGSIMYYKLIMEAQEEAPRYVVLRKIGMKKTEIAASIAKQLGMVYGIPLFVGLAHTLLGLLVYSRTLGEMGQQTFAFLNAVIVVAVFIAVYGLFYLLSVRSYYKIVH